MILDVTMTLKVTITLQFWLQDEILDFAYLAHVNRAWVITLVLENLNVTDGAKKFLLKRPKSKQIGDRSTIAYLAKILELMVFQ